ncbi:conjugative transposon protein TraN [Cellulophaga sp. F20128]|uniref:DUF4138 domain-containing protein n=1 Tax=Cellulophaga sp. F20128 TaxID=2926413 RepID=UPI001FF2ACCC|nr:DUF4138 domain-containing protein [Cellulophaga sp. F20128]MCK0156371.1 conjugative transposon protein TraN [Cellulophaga sp. F20128]
MRTFILLYVIMISVFAKAQTSKILDTIYANDTKNVALFFPEPIRQGITGSDNFVFTYNREKEQYFGLLQAKPGTESNLLTVTIDGNVYSYILKYSNILPKLNFFINKNESIGSELPKEIKDSPITKPVNEYANRITNFQKFSEFLLKSNYENIETKREKGIKLQLQKMTYDASEVYLVFEVKNKSGIDFEIDYLNVYRTNGNKKRNASYQRLQQGVIYKHKMPYSIIDGEIQRFVYVIPKFVLGDNEKLLLELKELKGNRKVILKTKL